MDIDIDLLLTESAWDELARQRVTATRVVRIRRFH